MRTLNKRERTLFWLCLSTFFLAANIFAVSIVSKRIKNARTEVAELKNQVDANRALLYLEDEAREQRRILDEGLPTLDLEFAGKTQGMLKNLQNEIRDRRFESDDQELVEQKSTDYYEEVAVKILRLRGDAAELMKLLISLQQPNQFYIIKNLELELDKKSQKKEPQAICNLTFARWFKPQES